MNGETKSEKGISLSKGVARFSGGTLISRVLGLVREQVFAILFGAGVYTDAFFAAFRIPNLLRDLFAEGALSAAFIPTFSKENSDKGKQTAFQLANLVFTSMAIIVSAVCFLGIIIAPLIVHLIAPGFANVEGQMALTVVMTRIMFPLLLFVSLSSIAMGILNTYGIFGIPALAPVMFNLAMIACGIFLRGYFDPPIIAMAVGVFIGGAGQLSFQIPALLAIGFRFKLKIDFRDERLKKIFRLMLPASLGTAAIQINIFVNTLLASFLPHGSLSYLNYGYRLMHLPLALFGVGVASVSLPRFSLEYSSNDIDGLKEEYISSLRFSLFLILPAMSFILAGAFPIVGTIFQHGKFSYSDTIATVGVLRLYASGLFAFATVRITSQAFFAMHDTKTPMKTGVIAVGVNIILNLILMGPFQYLGLAAATTIAGILNMTILVFLLRRRLGRIGLRQLFVFAVKIVGINLSLAIGVLYICAKFGLNSGVVGGWTEGIMLLALIVAYIVGYIGLSALFGLKESSKIIKLFRK